MTSHSNGTGTGWNETLDVDRQIGLDYQEFNDLRKGIRIRAEKQHTTYGASSCGGLHEPGRVSVLRVDTTPNLNLTVGDPTCFEWGIAYDPSGFIHYVSDTTTSWCTCYLNPQSICKSTDFTYLGALEFDGSVDFSGPVHVDGSANFLGPVDFSNVEISGTLDVSNIVRITNSVGCYSLVLVDGTGAGCGLTVDGSASVDRLHCGSNIVSDTTLCDLSGVSTLAMRLPSAWVAVDTTTNTLTQQYNVAHFDYSTAGAYCVSFTTALATNSYLPMVGCDMSSDSGAVIGVGNCYSSKLVTGFRCFYKNDAGTAVDPTRRWAVVFGGF